MSFPTIEEEKRRIVARCEHDRHQLAFDYEELDSQTRWIQFAIDFFRFTAPHVQYLIPVLGFFLASRSKKGRNLFSLLKKIPFFVGIFLKAWSFFQAWRPRRSLPNA